MTPSDLGSVHRETSPAAPRVTMSSPSMWMPKALALEDFLDRRIARARNALPERSGLAHPARFSTAILEDGWIERLTMARCGRRRGRGKSFWHRTPDAYATATNCPRPW